MSSIATSFLKTSIGTASQLNGNGLGDLDRLQDELIRKIFSEFLSLKECVIFLSLCTTSQAINQKSWEEITKKYILPIDAFGDLARCEEILQMPKNLLEFLKGPDGDLFFPVLQAFRFRHKKKIISATYEGIQKVSKLKKGLGYGFIWNAITRAEKPCDLKKMEWVVMPKHVLEGSRSLKYQDQVNFVNNWVLGNSLREGFSIPEDARDVIYMLLYHYCSNQEILYPNTNIRTSEVADGQYVTIGDVSTDGVTVGLSFYNEVSNELGVVVLKKFECP